VTAAALGDVIRHEECNPQISQIAQIFNKQD